MKSGIQNDIRTKAVNEEEDVLEANVEDIHLKNISNLLSLDYNHNENSSRSMCRM